MAKATRDVPTKTAPGIAGPPRARQTIDVGKLERALRKAVDGEVRFDTGLRGGCCGLAGSWGFESGKYDISMDCGEQALLPAVRDAEDDRVVVADGFSCKTQIKDAGTGREALHIAEIMKLAREHGARATVDGAVSAAPARPAPPWRTRALRVSAAVALAAAATAVGVRAARS
ncbi:hypothetical protein AB0N98_03535 [Streptomyces sp. NPDC093681]|uniref:hypothetical protein n=1 Tax=Streptomyces sp. NPDC093681 TaxID=3155202 RepID=UPI0034162A8F